ncbi:MAG TPA: transporter [Gammaproteobacteria bacterium]|nr:transporter [Gammaproteobacteria bacterium]
MMTVWPWWSGSLALSVLTLGYWAAFKRPLGVSGSWARIVMWRNDRAVGRAEAPFRSNPQLLKDALMAATVAHFGEQAVQEALAARRSTGGAPQTAAAREPAKLAARIPWTAHLTFLVMIAVGGLLTSALSSGIHPQFDLGALHKQLFGAGFGNWMTLFVGGGLVGFGTQLAGGCTSGHGLSGCSRLVPSSLAAIGIAFGTATAVSLLVSFTGASAL